MVPFAHSARPDRGIPRQLYADHVRGVTELASKNAGEAANYWTGDAHAHVASVCLAAEFHDLGKLEPADQAVLRSDFRREALPVNHVDAGVAHLLDARHRNLLAAALVYAHHIGLPDFPDESLNGPGRVLRDTKPDVSGKTVKSITDQNLDGYLELHQQAVASQIWGQGSQSSGAPSPLPTLLFRIALSCLVDADHYDSARHNGNVFLRQEPPLCPDVRLRLLDQYVRNLEKQAHDERDLLRSEVYKTCRNADPSPGLYSCDSPVGTGKTTAVMAHLLQAAKAKGLRRILVVLPFTNIIDQSVEVYRGALVDFTERQEDVVAAHHHKAEFEDLESRHLSFLWKAPIVVVTAVQFFETLASNRPGSLRKLHELPGSAIFIDEAHAALPAYLWPQAWTWLRELESEWGCHFVLGSGSLNRFWELEEFSKERLSIPGLVQPDVRDKAIRYEERRI
jgi:CRISPR-associated endonuclease/helicase Cas3